MSATSGPFPVSGRKPVPIRGTPKLDVRRIAGGLGSPAGGPCILSISGGPHEEAEEYRLASELERIERRLGIHADSDGWIASRRTKLTAEEWAVLDAERGRVADALKQLRFSNLPRRLADSVGLGSPRQACSVSEESAR